MARRYHQGKYKVKNPGKYLGDPTNVCYRSSWERRVFIKLDQAETVLRWGSETVVVPYISPKDGRVHRYFVDLIVVARGLQGLLRTTLIEIKPYAQTQPPSKRGKKKERYITECITYEVNQAKWAAARALCEKKGWHFKVMDERDIFPK